MKKILNALASLFRVETVWVDKGQGRWVRRRYYHPLTRIIVIVALLTLGISWGVNFFSSSKPEEPEPRSGPPAEPLGQRITTLKITDFFPEPTVSAEPFPGPIPVELSVDDDEYWVRIDKGDYRLYLYRGGDVEKSYKVGVGKNPGNKERAGDNKTPNGIFTVQSIENASSWTHDFRDGKGAIKGAYGPWFIRLKTGWRGIGIHGTHDPNSRGSMVSEGCIRMLNDELEELRQIAFKDMKVVIEE
ncbi:MAG: L,D-transpeptidase [Synergistaceae bacterium]|jgi:lipoprotein-anchoring transpeptidase ErfK/SrfK|nr:L,D-transpeptidase [Synergistaceae bacterium]